MEVTDRIKRIPITDGDEELHHSMERFDAPTYSAYSKEVQRKTKVRKGAVILDLIGIKLNHWMKRVRKVEGYTFEKKNIMTERPDDWKQQTMNSYPEHCIAAFDDLVGAFADHRDTDLEEPDDDIDDDGGPDVNFPETNSKDASVEE